MIDAYSALRTAYDEQANPIKERQQAILQDIDTIRKSINPEEDAARERVLGRQIDEAVVSGNRETADSKSTDLEKIRLDRESKEISIVNLRQEYDDLSIQLKALASKVLKEQYPAIAEDSMQAWTAAVDQIEEKWKALQRFEKETGAVLSFSIHQGGLIPSVSRPSKKLRERMNTWLG